MGKLHSTLTLDREHLCKPTGYYRYCSHRGDKAKIIDGPFTGFSGVVDEIHEEKSKLKLMISIFGRSTPVELEFFQVERL